ncbi:MAG: DNA alkylation repair protein [Sphingomonadaceae bacterium]
MSPEAYVAMLEAALRPRADASEARGMRAYLLDQFDFLGIRAPLRRQAIQALPPVRWTTSAPLLDIAQRLWALPEREFRYTAIDLLRRHYRLLDAQQLPELLALLQRDAWWETVDGLTAVIGRVILQQIRSGNHVAQRICDDWIVDPNYWVRRCAMLHQLGWRLETDAARLFADAQRLSAEKEFFIRKAIGWALRDYARWNPDGVRQFLARQDLALSALTRREASKHLLPS